MMQKGAKDLTGDSMRPRKETSYEWWYSLSLMQFDCNEEHNSPKKGDPKKKMKSRSGTYWDAHLLRRDQSQENQRRAALQRTRWQRRIPR